MAAVFATLSGVAANDSWAQTSAAGITGEVSDTTQAVIIGASVTAQRRPSGLVLRTVTDRRGQYRFEALTPGTYEVTVACAGFAVAVRSVTLEHGVVHSENVSLVPAPVSETVTVGFTDVQDRTAMKYDVPVRDVPIAVTSYTASFIEAVNARRTDELFPYMTGVTRADNTAYDFTIRGVRSREPNNILVDGMPGLPARFGSPTLADVDRIELLRGPASVQYGQIQPGGVLNLITKKPTAERVNALGIRFGSIASASSGMPTVGRVEADFAGRLEASAHWLYRLTFSYDDNGSFRHNVTEQGLFVSPVVTWVPNARTAIEASITYRRQRTLYDDGLVAPNNDITKVAAIQTRYQEPADLLREDGGAATLHFTRIVTPRTTWSARWRSVVHDDYRHEYENVQVAKDLVTLQRRDREQQNNRRYHYLDTNVKTAWQTGPLGHVVVVGVDGGYELRSPDQRSATSSPTLNINLYAPVYGAPRPAVVAGTFRRDHFVNAAVYAQDHITLSRDWKAVAAIRGDAQTAVYEDMRSGGGRTTRPSAWSPMAGLVFEPGTNWSVYGNASTSFAPPNPEAEDASGQNNFQPERGRQLELGTRAAVLNGRVETRAAVYRIVRQNVLQTLGGGVTTQVGEERSRGGELEGRVRLLGGFQMIAGYAYTDATISRDATALNVGTLVNNVPRNAANIWGRYDLSSGALRNLGFGVGLIYRGDRTGSFPLATAAALVLPAYTRADADIYYLRGRYQATIQAVNLTNRVYYESARSAIGIMPGTPRQVLVSLRTRF